MAQLCAHVGGVSGPGLPLPPAAVPLPTPKGLGQNRGVPALATDRCRSAGAQGALTSAPCCSCACQGGAWPPRLHTSSCTGSWAGPGDKVIGATPLKKIFPAGLIARQSQEALGATTMGRLRCPGWGGAGSARLGYCGRHVRDSAGLRLWSRRFTN